MDKKIKMILLRITFVIIGISIFVVIKKDSSKSEVTPVLEHLDDSLNDNSSNKNNSDYISLETDSKNKKEDRNNVESR